MFTIAPILSTFRKISNAMTEKYTLALQAGASFSKGPYPKLVRSRKGTTRHFRSSQPAHLQQPPQRRHHFCAYTPMPKSSCDLNGTPRPIQPMPVHPALRAKPRQQLFFQKQHNDRQGRYFSALLQLTNGHGCKGVRHFFGADHFSGFWGFLLARFLACKDTLARAGFPPTYSTRPHDETFPTTVITPRTKNQINNSRNFVLGDFLTPVVDDFGGTGGPRGISRLVTRLSKR